MQGRNINLSDVGGEGNLASALGLGTNAVGGIWKQIKKADEPSRACSLDRLAADVAGRTEKLSDIPTDVRVKQIARDYGISPDAVVPLTRYHEARDSQAQRKLGRADYFF